MTNILFHRGTPWQSEIRCSTNIYARLFQQDGFNVTYLQGLVHMGNLLARTGRWQSWAQGPRLDANAWVFTPLSIVPFAGTWPFTTPLAANLAYKSCLPSIRSLYRRSGFSAPDVIWTANPGSSALKSIYPNARLVFQVVDYYPAFSGSSIKQIEKIDYEKADHLLVIGETLKNYIIKDHGISSEKITVLGQGVFTDNYEGDIPIPEDIAELPGPVAVWVGVINKCDPGMFTVAAKQLKELGGSLVMIGPGAEWADQLKADHDNVHMLGPRTPEQVPAYLLHADVGLMLYDQSRQEIYKGQNPLKLYEYAAAGLPIISTPHNEYAYMDAPVIIVSNKNEVSAAINNAIENKEILKKKAQSFVADRTWNTIYARAKQQIEKVL
ncbi:MAG: hypothetical protein COA54_01245 [Thiotrichaceae bacterium]|nr:MAG: hypothetical protein COA54_01245 [Thiotrichaceae bacterium]